MRQRHLLSALVVATAVVAGCGGSPVSHPSAAPTVDPAEASSLLNSLGDTGAPTTAEPKTRPLPAGCSVVTEDDLTSVLGLTGFHKQEDSEPDSAGMASTGCTYRYVKTAPTIVEIGIAVTAFDVSAQGESMDTALDAAIPCTGDRVPVTGVWESGTQCTDSIAVASKLGGDYRILTIEATDPADESGIQWTAKLHDLAGITFPRLLS